MTLNSQNCSGVVPLLDAFHDGELADDEKVLVERHLRECESCSRGLDQVSKLVTVLKGMPTVSPRVDFADKFELLLKEQPAIKASENKVVFKKFGWVAAIAASIILSVGIGQYALHHGSAGSDIALVPSIPSIPSTMPNQVSKTLQEEQIASASAGSPALPNTADTTDTSDAVSPPPVKKQAGAAEKVVREHRQASNKESATATKNAIASNSEEARVSAKAVVPAEAVSNASPKHSLVAFYEPEANSIPEELGISTDEDGLYAIKM